MLADAVSSDAAGADAASGASGEAGNAVWLEAKGLVLAFGGQTVLGGVDLSLRRGDVILLRGENGAGKTSLINVLTGNVAPAKGSIRYDVAGTQRAVQFPRRWWRPDGLRSFAPEHVAKLGVTRVWQDVRLFDSLSVGENVMIAERQNGREGLWAAFTGGRRAAREDAAAAARACELLSHFGLGDLAGQPASQVSLGQSKRVAIARAVGAGARVLFLDEPLAGLDADGIRDVVSFLGHLARTKGVALVIVEHLFNHSHLQSIVTAEWTLAGGKLTAGAPGASADAGQPNSLADWFRAQLGASYTFEEERLPRGARLVRVSPAGRARGAPVLQVADLVVRRGKREVVGLDDKFAVTGLSFVLHEGELALLLAPNGWGKSTLVEAIAGLIPASGQVRAAGQDMSKLAASDRRLAGLGAVLSRQNVIEAISVRDHLAVARAEDPGEAMLPRQWLKRASGDLSGGQRQLLALLSGSARAGDRVRVFDEPFATLDRNAMERAAALVLPAENAAALICAPAA